MTVSTGKAKLIIDIDSDLKKDFKVLCAKKDTSMTEVLEEFVKKYIQKNQ